MRDACVSISAEAKQVEIQVETEVEVEVVEGGPVALFVMLDQSGSMEDAPLFIPPNKWQVATDAINAFVNDPASADLDIALQYFPLENGDCVTGAGYSTPDVPMGLLPDHAINITNSLASHSPGGNRGGRGSGGGTPIEGALRGVTSYCAQYKQDTTLNPEGKNCVAVLVTDGLPTRCSEDPAVLVGIAADAYANHEVMTFTIGMTGADFGLLDQIAQAGQADCTPDPGDATWACNVSTGGTTFIDALDLIRTTVTRLETRTELVPQLVTETLACEWEITEPPAGSIFDSRMVNVVFSPTGQTADRQFFGRVSSISICGDKLGWAYDNEINPTRIIACPRTCDTIQASGNGTIEIQLGCASVLF